MPGTSENRSATASVSAGIAAANAQVAQLTEPIPPFHEEDGGRSLAEMASRDLDAALQLLAERAQYITGATGAAIALRRGEHSDMLCRASAGSNAPELGALLSMEYGLSGESVRTRQTLRCDDAQDDPRVNREGCRQLGIASVVVMPIVSEQQVLGVFELFSGTVRAFEQRDISALQRLSAMVGTAVQHAVAAQNLHAVQETSAQAEATGLGSSGSGTNEEIPRPMNDIPWIDLPADELPENSILPAEPAKPVLQKAEGEGEEQQESRPAPAVEKRLFWSAAEQVQALAPAEKSIDAVAVPPVLRNLQKCKACGFPVSQGRIFCVECEEKQWRGQSLAAPVKEPVSGEVKMAASAVVIAPQSRPSASVEPAVMAPQTPVDSSPVLKNPADLPAADNLTLFLSSAAPAESWFAANKYILAALLVVALVIAAIVWLR